MTLVCDLCGSTDSRPLWHIPDRRNSARVFTVVQCVRCHIVFIHPRLSLQELADYYPPEYYSYHPTRGFKRLAKRALLSREVARLRRFLRPDAKILELGSGSGEDLAYLRDRGGWSVEGNDVSPHAAHNAKQTFDLDLHVGPLESLHLPDHSYDAVRMKYVLSHVQSPKQTLTDVHRILRPDGRLLLWVPNFDSLDRLLFGRLWQGQEPSLGQFYNFSVATISQYLEATGYHVESITHEIVPNTFVHSTRYFLKDVGAPRMIANLFRLNALTLLLFLPLALIAALLKRSDRILVVARKNS